MSEQLFGFPGPEARALSKVARERINRTIYRNRTRLPSGTPGEIRAYVVEPITTISAAVKEEDGTVTAGSGTCFLCRRSREELGSGSGSEDSAGSNEIIYQLDDDGEKVEVTVYNLCLKAWGTADGSGSSGADTSVQDRYVFATQDMFGDLWVTEACEANEGSSSSGSDPPSSGSDKSTAIVPASWQPEGFVALFTAEMPEVRFDDLIVVDIPQRNTVIDIDPKFVEVCAFGTIQVCGHSCDAPIHVGLSVSTGNRVRVRFALETGEPVRLVIRLTGIRKGFDQKRFSPRTREQFDANNRWLNSAYPGAGQ